MSNKKYNYTIDELIEILEEEKKKGRTELLVLGEIKANSWVIAGKKYEEEQSHADWQIERNGF